MAGAKVVSLNDLARELGVFSESHIQDLKTATVRGIARSVPDLVEKSPVDTGLYAQSWYFKETELGAILGNSAPYSGIVEYGMRPGYWVPIKPLLAWAKRVLKDPSQPPDYSSEVKSFAYAVQKKIHNEGIDPRWVMRDAIPEVIENIKQEYRNLGK